MSQIEDNKQRVRDFFDAMQRADAEAIAGAYADDGSLCTMGNTLISGRSGKEQIREFAGAVLESFPEGLQFNILGMTAEGERVAVEATSEGLHVSGKPYKNFYHFLFTWRDGELLELKEYMDTEVVTDVICGGQRP
jgi:uncharacterized protein (TIGR02246 family)